MQNLWLLVLPANTARSRRAQRTLPLNAGDGDVCWNDAVNATAASRSTRAARAKADDPHNLEGGALAARAGHISCRTLDAAGTLLLKRLATARRTPSTLAEYARAASTGDATDMPARRVRCSNSVLTADVV